MFTNFLCQMFRQWLCGKTWLRQSIVRLTGKRNSRKAWVGALENLDITEVMLKTTLHTIQ